MKEVKITKRAHDEIRRLFSSRVQINSLRTDPELTEIVDNFAFDKTLQQSEGFVLEKTRVMCILAATIGCNAINEFKLFVDACLNLGVKPREIREIVYMAYPYVGAALLVDYTLLMNDIFENNGIRLPLDPQSTVDSDEEAYERGLELLDETFGPGTGKMMIESAPKGQEHIGKFILLGNFLQLTVSIELFDSVVELLQSFGAVLSEGNAELLVAEGHSFYNREVSIIGAFLEGCDCHYVVDDRDVGCARLNLEKRGRLSVYGCVFSFAEKAFLLRDGLAGGTALGNYLCAVGACLVLFNIALLANHNLLVVEIRNRDVHILFSFVGDRHTVPNAVD